jgi:hypothetical protein
LKKPNGGVAARSVSALQSGNPNEKGRGCRPAAMAEAGGYKSRTAKLSFRGENRDLSLSFRLPETI